MFKKIYNWLTPASITSELSNGTDDEIFEELLYLLQKTGKVTDSSIVRNDIAARFESGDFGLAESLVVPHARSAGVSSLCAAAGIVNHNKIYVMVVWPENTVYSLKCISILIKVLLNPDFERSLMHSQNSDSVYEKIASEVNSLGISLCSEQLLY